MEQNVRWIPGGVRSVRGVNCCSSLRMCWLDRGSSSSGRTRNIRGKEFLLGSRNGEKQWVEAHLLLEKEG